MIHRILLPALLLAGLVAAEEPETKTTASGLKYQVLQQGRAGTNPAPGDRVRVHYTGWLTDGTKFDSSVDRGKPFSVVVGVGAVISGWDEGLQLMTVSSKFRFTIPSRLAYGEQGRGKIPAGADLVFEVELLGVKKGKPLPRFRLPDPEKSATTASGLKYEVLEEGTGNPPAADSILMIRHMMWNNAGEVLWCTEQRGQYVAGPVSSFSLPFLKEAAALMKVGGSYLFEVPPALAWGDKSPTPKLPPNSVTIWHLTLERIVEVPPFAKTAPENLKTTASGLGYEVLREGTGESPGGTDTVRVHYTGWLESGKEFDSSHRRGQPIEFPLAGVIPGWTEGVQLMKEGGIYRFTIPSKLGYGERGQGPIPGGATLIFVVELLEVVR